MRAARLQFTRVFSVKDNTRMLCLFLFKNHTCPISPIEMNKSLEKIEKLCYTEIEKKEQLTQIILVYKDARYYEKGTYFSYPRVIFDS